MFIIHIFSLPACLILSGLTFWCCSPRCQGHFNHNEDGLQLLATRNNNSKAKRAQQLEDSEHQTTAIMNGYNSVCSDDEEVPMFTSPLRSENWTNRPPIFFTYCVFWSFEGYCRLVYGLFDVMFWLAFIGNNPLDVYSYSSVRSSSYLGKNIRHWYWMRYIIWHVSDKKNTRL